MQNSPCRSHRDAPLGSVDARVGIRMRAERSSLKALCCIKSNKMCEGVTRIGLRPVTVIEGTLTQRLAEEVLLLAKSVVSPADTVPYIRRAYKTPACNVAGVRLRKTPRSGKAGF